MANEIYEEAALAETISNYYTNHPTRMSETAKDHALELILCISNTFQNLTNRERENCSKIRNNAIEGLNKIIKPYQI